MERKIGAMSAGTRELEEARLAQSLEAAGAMDMRARYRDALRALKMRDADAYAQATRYFESNIQPRLASDAEDPLNVWIDYGCKLGELSGGGRITAIDATGRAIPYAPPPPRGTLLLYLRDDTRTGNLVLLEPATASRAQAATISLLVEGKLSL